MATLSEVDRRFTFANSTPDQQFHLKRVICKTFIFNIRFIIINICRLKKVELKEQHLLRFVVSAMLMYIFRFSLEE